MTDTLTRRGSERFAMLYRSAARSLCDPYLIAVYWCIADHADEEGRCWPGIGRIGKETGMSEDKASKCVRELERRGLLRVTARTENGRKTSHEYVLLDVDYAPARSGIDTAGTGIVSTRSERHEVDPPFEVDLNDLDGSQKRGAEAKGPLTKESQMHRSPQAQRRADRAAAQSGSKPRVTDAGKVTRPAYTRQRDRIAEQFDELDRLQKEGS